MPLQCSSKFALVLMLAATVAYAEMLGAREISSREAAAQAQHQTDGKVLAVQPLTIGKRKVYRIKILTPDGQVRIVQVAAEQ